MTIIAARTTAFNKEARSVASQTNPTKQSRQRHFHAKGNQCQSESVAIRAGMNGEGKVTSDPKTGRFVRV